MLERTGQRLSDLNREAGFGIVGKAVILPALVSELGLQKKLGARYDARAIGGGQTFADSGFEVVLALVGGVDGSKAHAECPFGKGCGAVFLPGGAVEKIWEGRGHPSLCH